MPPRWWLVDTRPPRWRPLPESGCVFQQVPRQGSTWPTPARCRHSSTKGRGSRVQRGPMTASCGAPTRCGRWRVKSDRRPVPYRLAHSCGRWGPRLAQLATCGQIGIPPDSTDVLHVCQSIAWSTAIDLILGGHVGGHRIEEPRRGHNMPLRERSGWKARVIGV